VGGVKNPKIKSNAQTVSFEIGLEELSKGLVLLKTYMGGGIGGSSHQV
jgi:hypothetical protein